MQKLVRIGHGGTGEVWLVEDPVTKQQYAAKCLKEETKALLKHEAEVLNQLHHHGIPTYVGMYTIENEAMLCMEYIQGISLRDYLMQNGACSQSMVIQIASELLDILAYLHQHHIIHGDLKLQNVMMTYTQHIYVVDFGSASVHGQTAMGAYGTIGYAAPELLSKGTYSEQTDLYAFGKIVYALLSGIYEVEQLQEVRMELISHPWKFLLEQCLEENPAYRFQHVEEIQACLSLLFWSMPSKLLYLFASACLLLVWMRDAL